MSKPKIKNNKLGIILKKLRESRNMTVQELATKSETGVGTIGNIEAGANGARMSTLEKISEALELTQEERKEIFSCLLPKDLVAKLIKKEKFQKEDLIIQATHIFNDESLSDEDKKKIIDSLNDAYYEAKMMNKRKN